jgi:hypothetical protein
MISKVLVLLKDRLNDYLSAGRNPNESLEDQVVFMDGETMDPPTFKLGAISVLLINLEEENTTRPPDLYRRTAADGIQYGVQPEIRLNLYVLFVARYKLYEDALHSLSLIIQYFQSHRLLNHSDAPELIIELVTLPFSRQNEVWSALRVAYHPSVLYKVKMLVFQSEDMLSAPEIDKKVLRISQ